jgi:predicted nucleotide-binding protein
MQKPTLFIGSSSEGLAAARAIKEQFDSEMGVTLWNEGVFKLNTSTLESLLGAADYSLNRATS